MYVRASDVESTPDSGSVTPPEHVQRRVQEENTILQAEVEGMMRDSCIVQEGEERQRKELSQIYSSLPVKPGTVGYGWKCDGENIALFSVYGTLWMKTHEVPCCIRLSFCQNATCFAVLAGVGMIYIPGFILSLVVIDTRFHSQFGCFINTRFHSQFGCFINPRFNSQFDYSLIPGSSLTLLVSLPLQAPNPSIG